MRGYTNDKNTGLNTEEEKELEEEKQRCLRWKLEGADLVSFNRIVKEVTNHKYTTVERG